jgi:inner membrane protein
MDAQEPIRLRTNEKKSLKNSVTFRILIITVLALLLLIPSMMVQSLISERQSTSEETTNEVSSKWSYAQTVTGPVLNVPYQVWEKTSEKEGHYEKHTAHFLPENLKTSCELVPELRHRGIFDVVVYTAKIRFSGEFRAPDLSEWTSTPENISWDKVSLDLALSDLRGIENQAFIKFGNDSLYFEPGLNNTDFSEAGVSTKLVAQGAASLNRSFECELTLKGSNNIGFTPLGKLSSVEVSSTWPSPSFNGSFLPDSSVITDKGFVANWQVLHLNRNFPQQWTDGTNKVCAL